MHKGAMQGNVAGSADYCWIDVNNLLLGNAGGVDVARSLTRTCRAHAQGERFLEERVVPKSLARLLRLLEEVGFDPFLAGD